MSTPLSITTFTLGPFQTNCYVVSASGPACWVIDASFSPGPLIDHVRREKLTPEALILTHAHVDHIAGVAEVRRAFPTVPILIHDAEREWLSDPMLNLSAVMGQSVTAPGPDRTIAAGETLTLDGTTWRVLHTPGHSPGGVTLWCEAEGVAIVGDSLFAGSIGRTDFPGSDHDTLLASIRSQLYTLPPATKVYPGHGPPTTIGREAKSNPFVRSTPTR